MKVLVVNCGSSSIKYSLFDMDNEQELVRGLVEKIGEETYRAFSYSSVSKFNSIGKHEFVNSWLKEFPEPFIHANRFDSAINRFRKEGK